MLRPIEPLSPITIQVRDTNREMIDGVWAMLSARAFALRVGPLRVPPLRASIAIAGELA